LIPQADAAANASVEPAAPPPAVVMLSGRLFLVGCTVAAALILIAGRSVAMPVWLLAAETLATILGLFVFGSFKYQIHKNALTYGMLLVIVATFTQLPTSTWHTEIADRGTVGVAQHHSADVRGARRPDSHRHDAVHPG
jgi:hypothetical protein